VIPLPAGAGDWAAIADGSHEPQWQVAVHDGQGHREVLPITSSRLSRRHSGNWPRTVGQFSWPADGEPRIMPSLYKPYGTRAEWSYRPRPDEPWMLVADLHMTRTTLNRPRGEWQADCVDASGMADEDNIVPAFPFTFNEGEAIGDAVARLIRRTFPSARITVDPKATGLSQEIPAKFDADQRKSPWELVEALTDLVGVEVYITPDEAFVLRPVPQITASPVDSLSASTSATGYDVELNCSWNTVVLSYEDKSTGQVRTVNGVWQDTRTDSPLSVGRLGRRITLWESREGTPTQAQADAAARVLGSRAAGLARAVSITCLSRPWIEPGDTVAVTFQGGPVDELMQVTYADHDAAAHTSRFGLRNNRYVSQLEV
jgi:hypothetical protein